jgi:DMSO/TMAO reductase YedYZ molybdopterin-dependent catalytic subunit
VDLATWRLRIFGEVEEEITLDYEQLRALPATDITTDIHCVTRWSRFDAGFRGVHWRELAKLCRPKPSAHFVIEHAEVVPSLYFWKSAKWLNGIELAAADRPGFWERYGYHNDADPWEEERYGF